MDAAELPDEATLLIDVLGLALAVAEIGVTALVGLETIGPDGRIDEDAGAELVDSTGSTEDIGGLMLEGSALMGGEAELADAE